MYSQHIVTGVKFGFLLIHVLKMSVLADYRNLQKVDIWTSRYWENQN